MKICFISKYPPIEGGVSMHCYWAARGLAERGHQVFVVTNADEVEAEFRVALTKADRSINGDYAKVYPDTSGFVQVHSTKSPGEELYYIPLNNPSVTRLAGMATDLIRAQQCDVIFAYYFEPYGLAAHLASLWTGVPYVLKHAGSDLYRLAPIEELHTSYTEVMRGANRILSAGPSRARLVSHGVPEQRIAGTISFELPAKYFKPSALPLDLEKLMTELKHEAEVVGPTNLAALDESLPVLGIYGKLGEFKGTFDLLHAMSKLIKHGFKFHLLAMSNSWELNHFQNLVRQMNLEEYVRQLPFLPHWKVPGFIRRCTAVAFLERDFPIAAHGPTIPSEVIACGKCLIVSEEVAQKQRYRSRMRNFNNVVIVPDPKDHDVLAARVRFALENPQRAAEIGLRAFTELAPRMNHDRFIEGMESVLAEVAQEEPVYRLTKRIAGDKKDDPWTNATQKFPWTFRLLSADQLRGLKQAAEPLNGDASPELGRSLLLHLERCEIESYVIDVCRYECELQSWRGAGVEVSEDGAFNETWALEELGALFPFLRSEPRIVEFSSDVQETIERSGNGHNKVGNSANHPTKVLFFPNVQPMRINSDMEFVLQLLADGLSDTQELLANLCQRYQCHDESRRKLLTDSFLAALESLYREGIVGLRITPLRKAKAVTT